MARILTILQQDTLKIIRKYTNNHPSDYLVDENVTDFENLKVIDSKLEICGKGF